MQFCNSEKRIVRPQKPSEKTLSASHCPGPGETGLRPGNEAKKKLQFYQKLKKNKLKNVEKYKQIQKQTHKI